MGKEKRSWRPVPVQPSFPLGPGDTIITPTSLLSYFYLFVAIAFLLYIVSGLEADRNFGDTVNTFHDLPFGHSGHRRHGGHRGYGGYDRHCGQFFSNCFEVFMAPAVFSSISTFIYLHIYSLEASYSLKLSQKLTSTIWLPAFT